MCRRTEENVGGGESNKRVRRNTGSHIHRLPLKDRFKADVDVHREVTKSKTIRLLNQSIWNRLADY